MEKQVIYKIVEEVRLQCRQASFAYQNVRSNLNALDSERVFFFIDAFLFHANNLSDWFWAKRAESQSRSEQLRRDLQVADDSPLRLTAISPLLARPNEHLEDWMADIANRNYVDMNIMPSGTMIDFKPDKFHRSLDPETLEYHFRGAPCHLRKVADEIRRLEAATETWLRTHTPW